MFVRLDLLRDAALDALALLLPVECAGCGLPDRAVCAACRAALHPEPSGRRLVQDPAWQMSPVTQSVFWPHMVRQELVPQT